MRLPTKIRTARASAQRAHPGRLGDARNAMSEQTRRILDEFRLENGCSHLLRRAHFMAEELFSREFADEALTPRQMAALVAVHQQPGLSQNSLAAQMFMDRSTVAEMIKRLVASGMLRRTPSKEDQRAYALFLAPAGAALLDRVMPRNALMEQRILERLPEEYRPLFLKCLHLMLAPIPESARADD